MITMKELLMGAKLEDQTPEIQKNLAILLERINKVRKAYNKAMKVNDGLRFLKPENGAKKSNHFIGAAVDIDDDEKGTLWFWLMKPEQMQLLKDVGLWLEHGGYTHNKKYGTWVHFQIYPPTSKNRIYVPSTEANPNPEFWDGKYDKKYN